MRQNQRCLILCVAGHERPPCRAIRILENNALDWDESKTWKDGSPQKSGGRLKTGFDNTFQVGVWLATTELHLHQECRQMMLYFIYIAEDAKMDGCKVGFWPSQDSGALSNTISPNYAQRRATCLSLTLWGHCFMCWPSIFHCWRHPRRMNTSPKLSHVSGAVWTEWITVQTVQKERCVGSRHTATSVTLTRWGMALDSGKLDAKHCNWPLMIILETNGSSAVAFADLIQACQQSFMYFYVVCMIWHPCSVGSNGHLVFHTLLLCDERQRIPAVGNTD